MIVVSICLNDIPLENRRQDKNGKYWASVIVDQMRNEDSYGNTHTVYVSQSKEERAEKKPKVYIGRGKEYKFTQQQQPQEEQKPAQATKGSNNDLPW